MLIFSFIVLLIACAFAAGIFADRQWLLESASPEQQIGLRAAWERRSRQQLRNTTMGAND
jgi:hypothetical protein